jgi:hypothetical protein
VKEANLKHHLYRFLMLCGFLMTNYSSALAQQSLTAQKYLDAANQNYKSGQYEQSLKYFEAVTQLDPKSAQAFQGLGNCYYKLGNQPEALKAYDQSLALNPNNKSLKDFASSLREKSGTDGEMASDEEKTEIENDAEEVEEAMFKPSWTEQLGLNISGQPSQTGAGQVTDELDFTGTDHLTEGGHYFSIGGGAGVQKVEGASTKYGKLTLEGGLGLGFFLPSLEAQFERGQTALSSNGLTGNLNFQLSDLLTLGISVNGDLESHNGPASTIGVNSSTNVQIDDEGYSGSALVTLNPCDFLGFTLTGEEAYNDTYQIEGLGPRHLVRPIHEADRTDSISLMADINFSKNFELQITGQAGVENLPAGTVYSVVQAQTVTLTQAATQPFKGYSLGLLYNFE